MLCHFLVKQFSASIFEFLCTKLNSTMILYKLYAKTERLHISTAKTKPAFLIFDYRKAFDMIDHTLLLKKLEVYGLSTETLEWFTSYLRNRYQLVKLGNKQSNVANVPNGIPQGSILGLLLFIIFINDLPFHVTSSAIDLYADDTTLTSCANYSSIDRT